MGFDMEKMLQAFNEIQEESDNRERKVSERSAQKRMNPWDSLNEEDWTLFMEEVSDAWECEQYKERNMRSYSEIEVEVWNRWNKGK